MPSLRGIPAPLAVVLALAAALRLATAIAYKPALLYADSWGYLSMAFGHWPVSIAPLRPSGYPLALRVLSVFGRSLEVVTTAQHLAGLATTVVAYATASRLGARRAVAIGVAGLVGLDAYAIALEQHVLAEAFFTLAVATALYLSVTGRPAARRLAVAGLLLAAAALMRPVALFAVPVWLLGVATLRPGRNAVLVGGAAVLAPLLAYSAAHASVTGTFGLTQSNGWFLYGRVGQIVQCRPSDVPVAHRELCRTTPRDRGKAPNYFVFSRHSPARRAFGGLSADSRRQGRTDAELLRFSLGVIRRRPGAYAGLVVTDVARFFTPGTPSPARRDDLTLQLPARATLHWDDPAVRSRLVPGYRPSARPPARLLHAYGQIAHTPRWLLAACVLAALAATVIAPAARAWRLALLVGCALAMLVGAAAVGGFTLRYLIPIVPLLAAAGAAGVAVLETALRSRRGRRRAKKSLCPGDPGRLVHGVGGGLDG